MTFAEQAGLVLVAGFALVGVFLGWQAWLARAESSQCMGFILLAAVALISPPLNYFLFAFRDGLGPDSELSTGTLALSRWLSDAWPVVVVTGVLVACGAYLARRAT